jgi:hypothetical protein
LAPQHKGKLLLSRKEDTMNLSDPTPNEVQAAIIADLEAKLSLASEREFYIKAENARLRAENEDLAIRSGLRLSALDHEKLNAEAFKARAEKAEAEVAAERERVRVLREALESLAYWSRNKTESRITLRNLIAAALAATEEKP